uniref:Uncharacterized protein n=1 Tax=Arundo donax TaxID=35708 RepID=A0A0A9HN97_ARUDO
MVPINTIFLVTKQKFLCNNCLVLENWIVSATR